MSLPRCIQTYNVCNSLIEHIKAQCKFVKYETEQIQQLSRTMTSNFLNFPDPTLTLRTFQVLEKGEKFQNFPGGVGTMKTTTTISFNSR